MVSARLEVAWVPRSRSVFRENRSWMSNAARPASTMTMPTAAAVISSKRVKPRSGRGADIGSLGNHHRSGGVGNERRHLHLDEIRGHPDGGGPDVGRGEAVHRGS